MDCIKSGIIGAIVGDALGLPVQFEPRKFRDIDPVTKMTGNGAFDLPAGSWSDDSSLILATKPNIIAKYVFILDNSLFFLNIHPFISSE